MHECGICGEVCDCDMEDHMQPMPDDCEHECSEDEEYDDDFEAHHGIVGGIW